MKIYVITDLKCIDCACQRTFCVAYGTLIQYTYDRIIIAIFRFFRYVYMLCINIYPIFRFNIHEYYDYTNNALINYIINVAHARKINHINTGH